MRPATEQEREQIAEFWSEHSGQCLAAHARTACVQVAEKLPGWTHAECSKVALVFGEDGSSAIDLVGFSADNGEPFYWYAGELDKVVRS